jgi:FKBP-type peptidyl-prolyl cis-trans isomerase FkpA
LIEMVRSLAVLLLTISSCVLLAGCGGDSGTSPSASTPTAPYSQTDLRVGTGSEVTSGRVATVNYTGWLYDPARPESKGTQFDTSVGRAPFLFTVGAGQVIRGWDQGVPGMRIGGQRRLVIPGELAYGSQGRPPAIPPNATLVFDIELVAVQ